MTWFADLSECNYFGPGCAKHLRAVGWLEQGRPFPTGSVDGAVLAKLSTLINSQPWQPVRFRGWHTCDLCPIANTRFGDGKSYRNLFLPGQGTIYVCPEGILHYIHEHGYAPPPQFNRAVVECPPMGSEAYFVSLRAQGGEPLVDGTCFRPQRTHFKLKTLLQGIFRRRRTR